MIIISYGIGKSGSTLAFEMAKAVLELNGHEQTKLPDDVVNANRNINTVRRWTDEKLQRLLSVTRGMSIAVKTHAPPDPLSIGAVFDAIETGELKIHVVYRDPRDIVLSMIDHGNRSRARGKGPFLEVTDLDSGVSALRVGLRKLRRWGSFPSLKLCYDEIAFDPVKGPSLIADDLGVSVDADAVWQRVQGAATKRNRGVPHRWQTDMATEDAARIEATVPNFLRLVEQGDLSWFQRIG